MISGSDTTTRPLPSQSHPREWRAARHSAFSAFRRTGTTLAACRICLLAPINLWAMDPGVPSTTIPGKWNLTTISRLRRGAQTLQVGYDYRVKQGNYVDDEDRTVNPSFTGSISGKFVNAGDGAADLMMGYAAAVGAETFMAAHVQQRISAYYIQDDWKARKNFTVNLGMRYEYYTPPYGVGAICECQLQYANGAAQCGPRGAAGGWQWPGRASGTGIKQVCGAA